MIPALIEIDKLTPYKYLPEGVHSATFGEIIRVFGTTPHRKLLISGALRASISLKNAGCRMLYLDGSLISDKTHPNDFDGCWDPTGVMGHLLDPVLLEFEAPRARQKAKYGGELMVSSFAADSIGSTYLEYFQTEKFSGKRKGILAISL